MANNEKLPYPDAFFESYISNLSLHIVTEPRNMITEAYRVLKPGGAACFTVWGRKDFALQFNIVHVALDKYLNEEQKQKKNERTSFHIWEDEGANAVQMLHDAGFKGVKKWTQATNLLFRTGKEFLDRFATGLVTKWCAQYGFDDEIKQKAIQDVEAVYDELSGKNTTDLKTFEMGVLLAFKE